MFNKKSEILIFTLITLILFVFASFIGTSLFSPDSWGYYELSKTIFADNFYEFNTYRSYISDNKSAAFPFGYPILISTINNVIGFNPIHALYLNIFIVISVSYMILKISLKLNISYPFSLLLAFSILMYSPYMDEVYGGRSMPLAMLFYLIGIYLILNKKIFIAGLFLGLACLVRFDYLVFSLLTIIYYMIFNKNFKIVLFIGFTIGIIPWLIYSYTFFDVFWVSDNSWVAKSATSAFAGDFPTVSEKTLFSNPMEWITRIINNLFAIAYSLVVYSRNYLLAPIGLILIIFYYRKMINLNDYIFVFFLIIGMAPYATTGYFDARYFSLFFLLLSIFAFYRVNSLININIKYIYMLMILSFLLILKWCYYVIQKSYNNLELNIKQEQIIYKLREQQLVEDKRYIFKSPIFAVKYGALTGGKTAILPTNFEKLDEQTKEEYFLKMEPYILILDVSNE